MPLDPKQKTFFYNPPGFGEDWLVWKDMPAYNHRDLMPYHSIIINFQNKKDFKKFCQLVEQTPSYETKSIWYPKAEIGKTRYKSFEAENPLNPKYPVYIISKGRWESRHTSKTLDKIKVPYKIVIEPQEYKKYSKVIDPKKILKLPFSNLGQGSIPARNWVWEHAFKSGVKRHWILDDNIREFARFQDNLKTPVADGTIFKAAEDFVDRYKNVALAGFNYHMFILRKTIRPPVTLNTRIYSCILINNNIPFRWRGRYNEDTDLSIRVLKEGYCTVLFNAFLALKLPTMRLKGGNTDELYQDTGRLKMAESLAEQHPDIVKITLKWGRAQHVVNYRSFRKNKLIKRDDIKLGNGINNYGMLLKNIEDEFNED